MRRIEFAELRGDPAVSGADVRVAGRCYSGPVRLGDVFTQVATADDRRETALRVDQVLIYGGPSDELDPGLTAEIALSGPGQSMWLLEFCCAVGYRTDRRSTADGSCTQSPSWMSTWQNDRRDR